MQIKSATRARSRCSGASRRSSNDLQKKCGAVAFTKYIRFIWSTGFTDGENFEQLEDVVDSLGWEILKGNSPNPGRRERRSSLSKGSGRFGGVFEK